MTPNNRPLPWSLRVAAEMQGLAQWVDEEIAAGTPPKAVARWTAIQLRYFAARLKIEAGRR
jgi:hypothetical protein